MRPGVIRFGGSALDDPNLGDFESRDTIGDPDRRKPFRAWGGLQPVGPGLEEIRPVLPAGRRRALDLRPDRGDARPGTPPRKSSTSTARPIHTHGPLRARNGHPEPYRVRVLANRQRAGWSANTKRSLPEFCPGDEDRSIRRSNSSRRTRRRGILQLPATWLDLVARTTTTVPISPAWRPTCAAIAPDDRGPRPGPAGIRVAVTEWNTTAGDGGPKRARLWTLENALACARYHNVLHRHADLVSIACRSNLTNSFCSGCHPDRAATALQDADVSCTAALCHPRRRSAAPAGNTAPRPGGTRPQRHPWPRKATRSSCSRSTPASRRSLGRSISPPSASRDRSFEAWTLADTRNAGEPDAANSFNAPERVVPRRSTVVAASPRFTYRFPPLSLSVLRWHMGTIGGDCRDVAERRG